MNREEFIKAYSELVKNAVAIAAKARREGLLGLDSDIDREKAAMRDIFHYGLQFAVDGVACEIIDKILSNIIAQEEDGYTRILKTIQKEAAFCVQQGFNPKLLYYTLNSYTDLPIKDDVFCPADFDEDEAQYEHEEGKYDAEV
jgi:hypothetical protein